MGALEVITSIILLGVLGLAYDIRRELRSRSCLRANRADKAQNGGMESNLADATSEPEQKPPSDMH